MHKDMAVDELVTGLGWTLACRGEPGTRVRGLYTSDLLSDVMGNAEEGSALITIQAHRNSIAVASLIGMPLVIICHGRDIPLDMAEAADQEGIAVAVCPDNQFQASIKAWHRLAGLPDAVV